MNLDETQAEILLTNNVDITEGKESLLKTAENLTGDCSRFLSF